MNQSHICKNRRHSPKALPLMASLALLVPVTLSLVLRHCPLLVLSALRSANERIPYIVALLEHGSVKQEL